MILAPFITCCTRKARLFISQAYVDPPEATNEGYYLSLLDESREWVGCVVPNEFPSPATTTSSNPETGDKKPPAQDDMTPIDMVEISTRRYSCPGDIIIHGEKQYDPFYCAVKDRTNDWRQYEFYNVLWVEWVDGVAYRKGLGKVWKGAWDGPDTEEIDLVLG